MCVCEVYGKNNTAHEGNVKQFNYLQLIIVLYTIKRCVTGIYFL